jgi:hypothetical protein
MPAPKAGLAWRRRSPPSTCKRKGGPISAADLRGLIDKLGTVPPDQRADILRFLGKYVVINVRGLDIDFSYCKGATSAGCVGAATDAKKSAIRMKGEYAACRGKPGVKVAKDVENCVDASLAKKGIKTSIAGQTSSSGAVTVTPVAMSQCPADSGTQNRNPRGGARWPRPEARKTVRGKHGPVRESTNGSKRLDPRRNQRLRRRGPVLRRGDQSDRAARGKDQVNKREARSEKMLEVTGRVSNVVVDPFLRDRVRRWLVTFDVLAVHSGRLPDETLQVTLLVHSPAQELAASEVLGLDYEITLGDPLEDPYTGTFSLRRLYS